MSRHWNGLVVTFNPSSVHRGRRCAKFLPIASQYRALRGTRSTRLWASARAVSLHAGRGSRGADAAQRDTAKYESEGGLLEACGEEVPHRHRIGGIGPKSHSAEPRSYTNWRRSAKCRNTASCSGERTNLNVYPRGMVTICSCHGPCISRTTQAAQTLSVPGRSLSFQEFSIEAKRATSSAGRAKEGTAPNLSSMADQSQRHRTGVRSPPGASDVSSHVKTVHLRTTSPSPSWPDGASEIPPCARALPPAGDARARPIPQSMQTLVA